VIGIANYKDTFSSNYSVSEDEYNILVEILFNSISSKRGYSAFIISLLKEFNADINKILRVLNIGINGYKKVIPSGLYKFLVVSIKEAVIISCYKQYIEKDGFISIVNMAKSERLKFANIDRQVIIRTLKKYNIEYAKRK